MTSRSEPIASLKRQAEDLVTRQEFDRARALYAEVVEQDPGDADAWYSLSSLYGSLGRIDEAGACCRRAIALRPDMCGAHLNLGNVLFHQGRPEAALEAYRAALECDAGFTAAHLSFGHAAAASGRYEEALAGYAAALGLNPSRRLTGELLERGRAWMRGGQPAQADALFALVCEAHPDDADAWHLRGAANGRLAHLDEAATYCRRALALQPAHRDAHIDLGHVHFQQGRLDEAAKEYLEALEIDPQAVEALNNLGRAAVTPDLFDRYVAAYRHAVAHVSDPTAVRTAFIGAMNNRVPPGYDAWLDTELQQCYSVEGIDQRPIALTAAAILKYKYDLAPPDSAVHAVSEDLLRRLGGDRLFLLFLEKAINIDPDLELLLTACRRTLLSKYCRGGGLEPAEQRAAAALAQQCFNNEYVYVVDAEERQLLAGLKHAIETRAAAAAPTDQAADLTVYAMYDGLHTLTCGERLAALPLQAWPEDLRPLVRETLLHPLEEERIAREITALRTVRDRTSQLVRSQYEENPYPRWRVIPEIQPTDIRYALKRRFPHFTPPAFLDGPIRILVAGCGTGKQPIRTSLSLRGHDTQILAVDISRRSLAYGIRMARRFGVDNIEFMQADILDLAQLDRRFHIIECQGVLHHMEDPLRGWRTLCGLLVDGGLMSIGLYSRVARRVLRPLQEMVEREGSARDRESVRSLRNRILKGEVGQLRFLSQDFYSTSGCRDLIFHFMEHQYTPLQLQRMMADLGLEFIGFLFNEEKTVSLYRSHFPGDDTMTNLANWERFEGMYPETFAKMFQFWCRKA